MAIKESWPSFTALWEAYMGSNAPWYCAVCGIPHRQCVAHRIHGGLELAHIYSRGKTGRRGNVAANVLLLCATCHRAHHGVNVHNTGYSPTDSVVWPNVTTELLIRAKHDLGQLDPATLATVSGFTVAYIEDLAATPYPQALANERDKWGARPYQSTQTT